MVPYAHEWTAPLTGSDPELAPDVPDVDDEFPIDSDYRPVSSAARQAWINGYTDDECRAIDAAHAAPIPPPHPDDPF